MASEKKITMREYNGTGYVTLYPKTIASQVDGIYGKEEILTDATKELYGLKPTATPNEVFQKLAMPYGYYGFDVTTVFSDGTPAPNITLSGLEDFSGNTITTDENGRYPVAVANSKTPTISISGYIGVANTETTITAKDGIVFTPITIIVEIDTSLHFIESSQELKVITGCSVDMCIVGGGASGQSGSASYTDEAFVGGGGGYVTNILGIVLENPSIKLTVGAGGSTGGTTSVEYNGIIATAQGATGSTGNGSSALGSNGTDGTVHVFNDDSLPLPGGGGGPGCISNEGSAYYSGGSGFGGKGGSIGKRNGSRKSPENGKVPGGGGGGGISGSNGGYTGGGAGAAGGLYIRVNASEVSI